MGFFSFFQVFFFYFLLYFGWSRNEKRIYSRQGVAFGAGNMGLLLLLGLSLVVAGERRELSIELSQYDAQLFVMET